MMPQFYIEWLQDGGFAAACVCCQVIEARDQETAKQNYIKLIRDQYGSAAAAYHSCEIESLWVCFEVDGDRSEIMAQYKGYDFSKGQWDNPFLKKKLTSFGEVGTMRRKTKDVLCTILMAVALSIGIPGIFVLFAYANSVGRCHSFFDTYLQGEDCHEDEIRMGERLLRQQEQEHGGKIMTSLGHQMPLEIARVRELQDQYKKLRGMPNVMVEPQIMMMEAAIQQAISVSAEGDVVAMIAAFETLKGFQE